MVRLIDRKRFGRRSFLEVGGAASAGWLGMALQSHLGRAFGGEGSQLLKDRSVVLVFMHGGPSQIETFDPKMEAPVEIASATGEVSTKIPGVTFGGTFPKLASLADEFAIVRSFQTGDGRHDIKPVVGTATSDANLGALYARVAGQNRPESGMPTNVALYPRAVDETTMPAIKKFGDFEATGALGAGYAPFAPSGGGDLQQDMSLNIPVDRLDDRRRLLAEFDRARHTLDQRGTWEQIGGLRQQAFDTLLGGVATAFDLLKEPEEIIRSYDTAPLVRPDDISKQWKNYERYVDNAKSLGKLMLLARRLCERGCGFVTVTTNFVWDMHADQNNAGVAEGMGYMGLPFDHAISAFLEDVRNRGLSKKILLVCCGEMGRTPKINSRGGRDHWGGLAPLLMAGGDVPGGTVVGRSNRQGAEPESDPIRIPNLVSTILGTLFDVAELRLVPGLPTEILRAATAAPPIRFS